ncbi:MAG: Ig-like domain-containing protein [Sulfurovum sp.]|nr:Ig-like domain-containing protein [Sulfurovum sp.]
MHSLSPALSPKLQNVILSTPNEDSNISIDSNMTMDEDNNGTLTYTFSDADGDTVTATEDTAPNHGTVSIDGTTITYTPNANYHGTDSFVITLSDGNGYSVDTNITVTITSINDEPIITIDTNITTNEDTNVSIAFSVSDEEDGDLSNALVIESNTSDGSVTIIGNNIRYSPDANYHGSDSFMVSVTDSNGTKVIAEVNITVSSINDDPIITIDTNITTNEDTNVSIAFSVSDEGRW